WPLLELFDHRFVSFQRGLLKPDVAVFAHVAEVLGLPPERVLFIDDNTVNVESATAVGFRAARASGLAEARERIVEAGVLPANA
ncbi:MAG: HAD-IA family hydrolase, partial [Mycobacteriales bacterium]